MSTARLAARGIASRRPPHREMAPADRKLDEVGRGRRHGDDRHQPDPEQRIALEVGAGARQHEDERPVPEVHAVGDAAHVAQRSPRTGPLAKRLVGRLATQAMTPAVHRAATKKPPRNTSNELAGTSAHSSAVPTTPATPQLHTAARARRERAGPHNTLPMARAAPDQDRLGPGVTGVEAARRCRHRHGSATPSTAPRPPHRPRRRRRAPSGDAPITAAASADSVASDPLTRTPTGAATARPGGGAA